MGLIHAALGAASGVLADTWKDYFYCDALPENILAVKGKKRESGRSSNRYGNDNIITSGSVIAVADGQCMIIVDQGKVVELCAEPGEFTYDASTEPSIFTGSLKEGIIATFEQIGKRFTFGGEAPKDQRIYYINTKELIGNKYGTAAPVPFRVVDERAGIDLDISITCFGEYSYKISDPILFYTNVCGNFDGTYDRAKLDGQLKSELLTALQPAFARISEMGIRYSAVPGHTKELADALNEELSASWREKRGLEIVAVGVSSLKANEADEQMIKEMQKETAYMDPRRAAAHMTSAQASAMQAAASNENAGPMMAFAGMNMAANAGGINANDRFCNGSAAVRHRHHRDSRQHRQDGPAPVGRRETPASSVRNAEARNLHRSRQQAPISGPVPAARRIKANSVPNAVRQNRPESRSINVTSVVGNRQIRQIRRSSVRNAEIRLMTEMS